MSEQGFGDTLQFSRYALWLQQKGFDVTLLSQPALVPLAAGGCWPRQRGGQTGHSGMASTQSGLDAPSGCVAEPASTVSSGRQTARVTSRSKPNASTIGDINWGEPLEKANCLALARQSTAMNTLFIHGGRSLPFERLLGLQQLGRC